MSGGTGELMCSTVVPSTGLGGSRGFSIQAVLTEVRKSMGVRGRDAMREAGDSSCASTREATELLDSSHSTSEAASSGRGQRKIVPEEELIKAERKKVQSAAEKLSELMKEVLGLCFQIDLMMLEGQSQHLYTGTCALDERVKNLLQDGIRVKESLVDKLGKEDSIKDLKECERLLEEYWDKLDAVKRELEDRLCPMLLKELYQALIAPVKAALEGAEELLIVPHKELFEVPWAALTDADGSYLMERYVIRTAPSLRVARQAADKMQQDGNEPRGHVVLVGNPLPTRLDPLCFAENEVQDIKKTLKTANLEVLQEHYFHSDRNPPATKTNVKRSLEGAAWVHVACHADLETDALVLALPADKADQDSDLTMREVQGSEGAQGVLLAQGATVVLSACNTARGEIMGEGVVGLARGFLFANASATVASLWSVHDGSTAALMSIKYSHLAQGCTVPQALRLAMLCLARSNPADGLPEAWTKPYHWAGFLVVGATTRLPLL